MALHDQPAKAQSEIRGRRIPHPASTGFDDDNEQRPQKRLRRDDSVETANSSAPQTENESDEWKPKSPAIPFIKNEIPDSEDDTDDDVRQGAYRPTELESALPQVDTDKEAIAKYESLRFDDDIPEDLKVRLNQRTWVKGKSSIYVDAFNLALGTVLDDEAHLFDEKEMEVFRQWQDLDYEAQYL